MTYFFWFIVRIYKTTLAHSGYGFPWDPFSILPIQQSADYHDFHHYHNLGNYATFTSIWDTLFGTNKAYYEYKKKQIEKKKKI